MKSLVKQNDGNGRGSDRPKIAEQSKFVDRKYFEGGKKMKEDLDFFFNNNANQPKKRKYETKKIKPYNTTRIKSRNFLTNISYNGVKEEDLCDKTFVFDVHVLTTKNINPFSLERKVFELKNKEMIIMFWKDCNEPSFYTHICKPDNFLYLNGKNVIYP